MYSNCCCSCSFEREIIKIGQSTHEIYSNNILNFQESTVILNACTKKSGNLLKAPCTYKITVQCLRIKIFYRQLKKPLFKIMCYIITVIMLICVYSINCHYSSRVHGARHFSLNSDLQPYVTHTSLIHQKFYLFEFTIS